jgi:hypothetical protein
VTNDLGHQIAARDGDVMTLGAYRRGNRRSWLPGALIDSWVPCARGEVATGVPQPHVYFIQTIGERSVESGSIYCAACRAELAALRASGGRASLPPPVVSAPPAPSVPQSALPF